MKIPKTDISNLKYQLNFKDKILLYILKKYSYEIYKIGFNDGFNWKK